MITNITDFYWLVLRHHCRSCRCYKQIKTGSSLGDVNGFDETAEGYVGDEDDGGGMVVGW